MLNRLNKAFWLLLVLISTVYRPASAGQLVVLKTNFGDITIALNAQKAPITVANFLNYVNENRYNNTIFHRVIDGFMIQGGGLDATMKQLPTEKPIINEANNGLKNSKGTIAMARLPAPNSATNQFFINLVDNHRLDYPSYGGYTVFGQVVKGMSVVEKIGQVDTEVRGQFPNVPKKPVFILSTTLLKSNKSDAPQNKAESKK